MPKTSRSDSPSSERKKRKLDNTEEHQNNDKNGNSEKEGGGEEKASGGELYEVERLVDKMFDKDGSPWYLVKWLGYGTSDNTWEPIGNLLSCLGLVQEFEEKIKHTQIPDEILSRRVKNGIVEYRVKWKGAESRTSWVPDSSITDPQLLAAFQQKELEKKDKRKQKAQEQATKSPRVRRGRQPKIEPEKKEVIEVIEFMESRENSARDFNNRFSKFEKPKEGANNKSSLSLSLSSSSSDQLQLSANGDASDETMLIENDKIELKRGDKLEEILQSISFPSQWEIIRYLTPIGNLLIKDLNNDINVISSLSNSKTHREVRGVMEKLISPLDYSSNSSSFFQTLDRIQSAYYCSSLNYEDTIFEDHFVDSFAGLNDNNETKGDQTNHHLRNNNENICKYYSICIYPDDQSKQRMQLKTIESQISNYYSRLFGDEYLLYVYFSDQLSRSSIERVCDEGIELPHINRTYEFMCSIPSQRKVIFVCTSIKPHYNAHQIREMFLSYHLNLELSIAKYNSLVALGGFQSLPTLRSYEKRTKFRHEISKVTKYNSRFGLLFGYSLISKQYIDKMCIDLKLAHNPSVICAHYANTLGIWILDNDITEDEMIGLTVSQHQFNSSDSNISDSFLPFEITDLSKPSYPSELSFNIMIKLMKIFNFEVSIFETLIEEFIKDICDTFTASPSSALSHLLKIQKKSIDEIEAIEMIMAGFDYSEPRLRQLISSSLFATLNTIKTKMIIPIQKSRKLIVIPDFLNVLGANQIFVQLSNTENGLAFHPSAGILSSPLLIHFYSIPPSFPRLSQSKDDLPSQPIDNRNEFDQRANKAIDETFSNNLTSPSLRMDNEDNNNSNDNSDEVRCEEEEGTPAWADQLEGDSFVEEDQIRVVEGVDEMQYRYLFDCVVVSKEILSIMNLERSPYMWICWDPRLLQPSPLFDPDNNNDSNNDSNSNILLDDNDNDEGSGDNKVDKESDDEVGDGVEDSQVLDNLPSSEEGKIRNTQDYFPITQSPFVYSHKHDECDNDNDNKNNEEDNCNNDIDDNNDIENINEIDDNNNSNDNDNHNDENNDVEDEIDNDNNDNINNTNENDNDNNDSIDNDSDIINNSGEIEEYDEDIIDISQPDKNNTTNNKILLKINSQGNAKYKTPPDIIVIDDDDVDDIVDNCNDNINNDDVDSEKNDSDNNNDNDNITISVYDDNDNQNNDIVNNDHDIGETSDNDNNNNGSEKMNDSDNDDDDNNNNNNIESVNNKSDSPLQPKHINDTRSKEDIIQAIERSKKTLFDITTRNRNRNVNEKISNYQSIERIKRSLIRFFIDEMDHYLFSDFNSMYNSAEEAEKMFERIDEEEVLNKYLGEWWFNFALSNSEREVLKMDNHLVLADIPAVFIDSAEKMRMESHEKLSRIFLSSLPDLSPEQAVELKTIECNKLSVEIREKYLKGSISYWQSLIFSSAIYYRTRTVDMEKKQKARTFPWVACSDRLRRLKSDSLVKSSTGQHAKSISVTMVPQYRKLWNF